jgi:hypothetical protein
VTADTITVDPELARQALGQVLDEDAALQPDAAPPPKRTPIEGATPEAPWGFKADGTTPRKGPPGPGRPRNADKADQARVDDKPPAGPAAATSAEPAGPDTYAEDLHGALTTVWLGLSMIRWTRGHAAVVQQNTAPLATAWAIGARQNKQVRGWVVKLSGEGSWGWIIPVAAATAPVVIGLWEVTRNAQLRAELAAGNDKVFDQFLAEQMAAIEALQPEAEGAGGEGQVAA